MRDLILLTKLSTLKTNLAQVQHVLEAVADQRRELVLVERLLDREEGVEASLNSLENALFTTLMQVSPLVRDERAPRELLETVYAAQEHLKRAFESTKTAKDLLQQRRSRYIAVDSQSEVGRNVNGTLVETAGEWMEQLDQLQGELLEKIRRASEAEEQATLAPEAEKQALLLEAKELRQEAWNDYRRKTLVNIRPIFTEYVDFLRGLAVRDLGFDAGICQLADELLRPLSEVPVDLWKSFTILARDEAVDKTMAKIIRLPFPEWTLWALPLAAHEFGHLVGENAEVRQFVEENASDAWPAAVFYDCLADAFATYAMGPAYAMATILLRFEPVDAFSDLENQASHAKRAAVVLAMLRRMDEGANPKRYADIVGALEKAWDEALFQAAPGKSLTPQDIELIDKLIAFQATFLKRRRTEGYSVEAMDSIAEWPERLGAGDSSFAVHGHQLRDVLNAAWWSRLLHPDRVDVIEEAALALWMNISKPDNGQDGRKVTVDLDGKGSGTSRFK